MQLTVYFFKHLRESIQPSLAQCQLPTSNLIQKVLQGADLTIVNLLAERLTSSSSPSALGCST